MNITLKQTLYRLQTSVKRLGYNLYTPLDRYKQKIQDKLFNIAMVTHFSTTLGALCT